MKQMKLKNIAQDPTIMKFRRRNTTPEFLLFPVPPAHVGLGTQITMMAVSYPLSSNGTQVCFQKGGCLQPLHPVNHLLTHLGDVLSPRKHYLPQLHPQTFTTITPKDIALLIRVVRFVPASPACSGQVLGIHLDVAATTQLRKNARCSNNRCYSYLFLFWQLIEGFYHFQL